MLVIKSYLFTSKLRQNLPTNKEIKGVIAIVDKFKGEKREYPGLLQRHEKSFLIKLAKKTPKCLNSDHFTLLALFSALLISLCYYLGPKFPHLYLLASIFWFFHWLFDALDGTLARIRHRERPRYGFYTDHLIDCISVSVIGISFALSGISNSLIWLVLTVIILLFFIHQFLRVSVGENFVVGISVFKIGSTEARVLVSLISVFLYFYTTSRISTYFPNLIDLIGLFGLFFLIVVFAIETVPTIFKLKKIDENKLKQKVRKHKKK